MRKFLITIFAALMLLAGTASASRVTSVRISHDEAFTIGSVDVEGEVRYTHQTEVAKDGKPFRIIVNILSATHEMGARKLINFPDCKITGIRSSQFSVEPENIVRVVFEMKEETAYRIDSDEFTVKVYVYDPDAAPFPVWSSLDEVNGKDTSGLLASENEPAIAESTGSDTSALPVSDASGIIASINMALDEDRKLGLESKNGEQTSVPETTFTTAKSDTSAKQPPADKSVAEPNVLPKETVPAMISESTAVQIADSGTQKTAAQILEEINNEIALSFSDRAPKESTAVSTEQKDTSTGAPAESAASALTTDSVSPATDTNAGPAEMPVSKPDSIEPSKPDQESPESIDAVQKISLPVSPNKTEPGKLAEGPVETGTIDVPESDDQSTARFRRDPSKSKKIRGTLVAEFPTRLVIKYKGKSYRDPFETLINETKVQNSPMEQRVPNVEGLRLVGILEAYETNNSALFEDKDGYGYILKAGDKVQKGYVLRVDEDRVYFQIFEYGWSRTVALDMEIF